MTDKLELLISRGETIPDKCIDKVDDIVPDDILRLYRSGCGYYCLASALLIRPLVSSGRPQGAIPWNRNGQWQLYFNDDERFFIFAEDAFGDPFCWLDGNIIKIDMETSERELVAGSLTEWAEQVLDHPNELVNAKFMSDWASVYGTIDPGFRLAPKVPFVLGGDFALENIYVAPELELLAFRSELFAQIKGLPDGTAIEIDIT